MRPASSSRLGELAGAARTMCIAGALVWSLTRGAVVFPHAFHAAAKAAQILGAAISLALAWSTTEALCVLVLGGARRLLRTRRRHRPP